MNSSKLTDLDINTPALVYDQTSIKRRLSLVQSAQSQSPFQFLYSIKSASFKDLLEDIIPFAQGFSVSSLNEARLAREISADQNKIHFTSPGLKEADSHMIGEFVDYISFNSISQYQRLHSFIEKDCQIGLRINPQTNFGLDERYDPCRPYTKLGATIADVKSLLKHTENRNNRITGLHIHNNCQSKNLYELHKTVTTLLSQLDGELNCLEWINLGGGYLFKSAEDLLALHDTTDLLKAQFANNIFIEPGKAIVDEGTCLLATVIDMFNSDGRQVVVLDTTVNHLPEVFEYQLQPKIHNTDETGEYLYRIVGCSCLSGDIFGDYRFNKPLSIGSRIIIADVGAYMFVKANMFNGINLPDVYLLTEKQELRLIKSHDYEDYKNRLG